MKKSSLAVAALLSALSTAAVLPVAYADSTDASQQATTDATTDKGACAGAGCKGSSCKAAPCAGSTCGGCSGS